MKTKRNKLYETPATTVVELQFEGIICQSNNADGSINLMGAPEDLQ